jgi:hypothetical protein
LSQFPEWITIARMFKLFLFVVLGLCTLCLVLTTTAQDKRQRKLSGTVYFTNNTPRERHKFPIQLYARDQRRSSVQPQRTPADSLSLPTSNPESTC